jgi:chromosome segregation ATPase
MSGRDRGGGPRILGLVAVLALTLAAMPAPPPAFAAADNAPDTMAQSDEFSRQLGELKSTMAELNRKIEESAKSFDGTTDVEQARHELEELRASVSGLLGAVADNGVVSQLGAKALKRVRDKLKMLEQDARFSQQERAYLLDRWRELNEGTERATEDLGRARKRLAELLGTLQANEDFIDELVQLREGAKALQIIRQLTTSIRSASDDLARLIGGIKPPGV